MDFASFRKFKYLQVTGIIGLLVPSVWGTMFLGFWDRMATHLFHEWSLLTPRRSQHPKTHPHEMNIVEAEKKLQDESHELREDPAGRGDAAITSIETEVNKTRERLQPTVPTRDHESAPEPHETR
jgi:hypothetical protein